jgi:hypothetical protein
MTSPSFLLAPRGRKKFRPEPLLHPISDSWHCTAASNCVLAKLQSYVCSTLIARNVQQRMTVSKEEVPVISNFDELLRYGVVSRVPIVTENVDATEWKRWAAVSPSIMTSEGDGEYAFYRNILEEPEFPFEAVLQGAIGEAILKYFNVSSLCEDVKLDDAFCIQYNMDQEDTRGAKHMDPSDITVNLCLEKTDDCKGSQVMFYGTEPLQGVQHESKSDHFRFLVNQEPGYATLHWGNHSHETTALQHGKRTNIVMTYCYADPSRSDVATRACYHG